MFEDFKPVKGVMEVYSIVERKDILKNKDFFKDNEVAKRIAADKAIDTALEVLRFYDKMRYLVERVTYYHLRVLKRKYDELDLNLKKLVSEFLVGDFEYCTETKEIAEASYIDMFACPDLEVKDKFYTYISRKTGLSLIYRYYEGGTPGFQEVAGVKLNPADLDEDLGGKDLFANYIFYQRETSGDELFNFLIIGTDRILERTKERYKDALELYKNTFKDIGYDIIDEEDLKDFLFWRGLDLVKEPLDPITEEYESNPSLLYNFMGIGTPIIQEKYELENILGLENTPREKYTNLPNELIYIIEKGDGKLDLGGYRFEFEVMNSKRFLVGKKDNRIIIFGVDNKSNLYALPHICRFIVKNMLDFNFNDINFDDYAGYFFNSKELGDLIKFPKREYDKLQLVPEMGNIFIDFGEYTFFNLDSYWISEKEIQDLDATKEDFSETLKKYLDSMDNDLIQWP